MRNAFRWVGYLEGISLLVLLGIAMPMKYLMGEPMAVKLVGWAHGLLFMGYIGLLGAMRAEYGWPLTKTLWGFVAAVLPFGTFVFERRLSESGTAKAG